jgi:transposase
MGRTGYFYTEKEINVLKKAIKTGSKQGLSIPKISESLAKRFNVSISCIQGKIYKIVRDDNSIKIVRGYKKKTKAKGYKMPEGTVFEGTPKKVEIYKNYFKVYF